jgi:hypothetical protein
VVTKPQNVLVLRDVHCARYVAGGNCKFFGDSTSGDVGAAVNARLNFTTEGGDYDSMLCFGLSDDEVKGMASKTAISLSDRILPWSTDNGDSGLPASINANMKKALGLDTIHYGQDVAATRANEYLTAGSINNATCFLGPSRQMGLFKPGEWALVPGQGHFGPDARPGDARWRAGEAVSMESSRAMIGDGTMAI